MKQSRINELRAVQNEFIRMQLIIDEIWNVADDGNVNHLMGKITLAEEALQAVVHAIDYVFEDANEE